MVVTKEDIITILETLTQELKIEEIEVDEKHGLFKASIEVEEVPGRDGIAEKRPTGWQNFDFSIRFRRKKER